MAVSRRVSRIVSVEPQIWSKNFIGRPPLGPDLHGTAALRAAVQAHRSTFPDWREDVQEIVVEDGRVAARWISTGTDEGGFLGNPATGRRVRIREMGFYRIEDGRIVEQWVLPDLLSLRQQLGRAPDAKIR